LPAVPDGRYCEVSVPASDLCLALWNRSPTAGLDVRGDGGVLSTWLERMHVQRS
jgi:hypothetical protein